MLSVLSSVLNIGDAISLSFINIRTYSQNMYLINPVKSDHFKHAHKKSQKRVTNINKTTYCNHWYHHVFH